jgi:hypothetical protein
LSEEQQNVLAELLRLLLHDVRARARHGTLPPTHVGT